MEFRELQLKGIREEQRESDEEVDPDSAAVSAEEVSEEEALSSDEEETRPRRRVLQLVRPVETRWNSTFFMIQRYVQLGRYWGVVGFLLGCYWGCFECSIVCYSRDVSVTDVPCVLKGPEAAASNRPVVPDASRVC